MMVAEVGGRGQSGSPMNGEMACRDVGGGGYMSHSDVLLSPLSPVSSVSGDYYVGSGADLKRKEQQLFTQRKQREFIPDNKKDDNYWDRRRRNNEAAKRSREKRRFNDMVLEQRVVELTKENHVLKAQLEAIKQEYGICGEQVVCVEKVLATLPTSDQVLSMTKRPKLGGAVGGAAVSIPTPVIHQPIPHSPPPPAPLLHHLQLEEHDYLHQHHGQHHSQHQHVPFSPLHAAYHPHLYGHHQHQQHQHQAAAAAAAAGYEQNALNLSARSRPRSPYDVSASSGGEDEPRDPPQTVAGRQSPAQACQNTASAATAADSPNNSLPLKLRHKSHLGDKDQAASALLALHAIKQEPAVARTPQCASPPSATPPWDGEGSSDERDSGISLGAEWTPAPPDNKRRLHSEIVRLSTEVANLKSLVIRTAN